METKTMTYVEDDGLYLDEVGEWAERKYQLVSYYSSMFATSMKGKWDCRVYIDLFAGPGRAKVRGSNKIVSTSPILAIDIPDPFDKYIFCDENEEKCDALENRLERDYQDIDYLTVKGDCNSLAEKILSEIPRPSKSHKVLSFCFVDPYNVDDLCFSTLESLSKMFIDFLILIPSHMDINRNEQHYLDSANPKLDIFLGNSEWRS